MNKRWINTKVEFVWDGTQYVEQSSEGYWYDGEMALCDSWASMSGTKYGYGTILRPATNDYAGFQFHTEDGNNAGFLLVKGNNDGLPTYSSNGITLVADAGHLSFGNRSHSHGIRFSTDDGNETSDEGALRMQILNNGNVGIGAGGSVGGAPGGTDGLFNVYKTGTMSSYGCPWRWQSRYRHSQSRLCTSYIRHRGTKNRNRCY